MPRYKIIIEYHGRDFVGWQRHDNGFSVQQALEEAIEKFSGEEVTLFRAGRTDSGVHALGQAAHFDLERDAEPDTVRDALNFHLKPAAVTVLGAAKVENGFDARLSAKERAYVYRITNRRAPLTVGRGLSWWVPVPLDDAAMAAAAMRVFAPNAVSGLPRPVIVVPRGSDNGIIPVDPHGNSELITRVRIAGPEPGRIVARVICSHQLPDSAIPVEEVRRA